MSVKHTLLALLYQQPMHGYELGKQLNLVVNAEWDVKLGQIASTLARLKDAHLVDYEVEETDDAPDRKVYYITEEGRRELEDWYLSPEVRQYRLGDAFYMKLVLSLVGGRSAELVLRRRRELSAVARSHGTQPPGRSAHAATLVLLLESDHAPGSGSALIEMRSPPARPEAIHTTQARAKTTRKTPPHTVGTAPGARTQSC